MIVWLPRLWRSIQAIVNIRSVGEPVKTARLQARPSCGVIPWHEKPRCNMQETPTDVTGIAIGPGIGTTFCELAGRSW